MSNRFLALTRTFLNPWTVFLFFAALLPRVLNPAAFITSDERTNIFLAGNQPLLALLNGNLRETYWHFYPGVTMTWLNAPGLWGQWLFNRVTGATEASFQLFLETSQSDILTVLAATRLPYALLTALFVPLVYWLIWQLLDPRRENPILGGLALSGAFLLALDPFFLAHSRVVHGDAPVSVFMGLSFLALLLYFRQGGRGWLIFSAVNGALAALTKAPGQLIAVMVVVLAVVYLLAESRSAGRLEGRLVARRAGDVLLWAGVSLLTFVALWPSVWVDPVGTFNQMLTETFGKVNEGHLVYFMGQPTPDPGAWFYPYVLPFRLTPITSLGLLLSLFTLWKAPRPLPAEPTPPEEADSAAAPAESNKPSFGSVLNQARAQARASEDLGEGGALGPHFQTVARYMWLFCGLLLLFGLASAKKQDRYLLVLFPMFDVLAAMGWFWLVHFLLEQRRKLVEFAQREGRAVKPLRVSNLFSGLASVLMVVQAVLSVPAHPYYLAYFNPLMGGLDRAVETTLVGWGEGMEQAAAFLNLQADAAESYVAAVPAQTFLPYFVGQGENFYTNDVALRADYVVLYRAQVQRLAPSPEIVRAYQSREPLFVGRIDGVPYVWVYDNEPLIQSDVPPTATLTNIGFGEVMRLAGYALAEGDDPAPSQSLTLNLYWHALPGLEAAVGECYEAEVEYFTATVCPRLEYAISVRLLAPDGSVVAQNDSWPAGGLLPTSQWRVGDYVQDQHSLTLPAELPPRDYNLAVVVYEAESGAVLAGPVAVGSVSLGR